MKFPPLLPVVAAACVCMLGCGMGGGSGHPGHVNPDFVLSLSSAQSWSGGASGSEVYTIQVRFVGGFSGTVALAVTGLPNGITGTLSALSISASGTSTLTLTGAEPAIGSYPFTISGTSGSLAHTVDTSLFVPGPVATNVLIPPGALDGSDGPKITNYLENNPTVTGGTFQVEWSAIDNGSSYNWSYSDNLYSAWATLGKKVNFIFWANADSSSSDCTDGQFGDPTAGNCAVPMYVWQALGSKNYTVCTPSNADGPQRIPNYFNSAFQDNYKSFIKAMLAHYGNGNYPKLGYIRIGLGRGGETIPVGDWDSGDACSEAFASWGLNDNTITTTWEPYLQSMLNVEAQNNPGNVQLMVGITPMTGGGVPQFVANTAVPLKIGFGSQGLQESDVNNCAGATADWCDLFNTYTGKVPLELQTVAQSCPDNSCVTGSLANLLPFAVFNKVTILEIYYQDWLVAYDPNYPGYTQSYQAVLESANTGQ